MENNGKGQSNNKPGLYRHPESGAEIFVTHHPKLGSAMADGAVAQGFKWVSFDEPKTLAVGKAAESEAPAQSGKPLTEYNMKELVAIAKEVGVENAESFGKPGKKKQDLINAIENAQ